MNKNELFIDFRSLSQIFTSITDIGFLLAFQLLTGSNLKRRPVSSVII